MLPLERVRKVDGGNCRFLSSSCETVQFARQVMNIISELYGVSSLG